MKKKTILLLSFIVVSLVLNAQNLRLGDERLEEYLYILQGEKVGVVCNQSSYINNTFLVDTLLSKGINITEIFSPEHGLKGSEEAGKEIGNSVYEKDSIPIISLYGNNKKPTNEQMNKVDVIVFDLQDVGCRFYTYISTLELVMKACVENDKQLIVLDRVNPNNFVDGPVLDTALRSFVGMQPIPICYGLTIGEYALMLNGENWINEQKKCKLSVIEMENYCRQEYYSLFVCPSPNLKTDTAIMNYPTLCLFEGTKVSVGRGTNEPFQVIGYPRYSDTTLSFAPISIKGVSEEPPYKDSVCYGKRVVIEDNKIHLQYLIDMYNSYPEKEKFFSSFFDKLCGTTQLKEDIKAGKSEQEIRKQWEEPIKEYLKIRNKYLIYN
jgi:uncharacterized protein YbbC (DUF1343 family)